MREETRYIIQEAKQKALIDDMIKERTIEFDKYFKDSGKIEKQTKRFYDGRTGYSAFFDKPEDYVPLPTARQLQIKNDMSKYKFNEDQKEKIIKWKTL